MGCTHSKKNSKISSEKSLSVVDRSNVSQASAEDTESTSIGSLENTIQRYTNEKASVPNQKAATPNYHNINKENETAGAQPPLEGSRIKVEENVRHPSPHPETREAAREAARAAAREAAKEAAKQARKERRKREERQRSNHQPPPVINTFWDQEDHDYIVQKNIQRNQRRLHAMQDRDETDDTLFEIPIRMPEVDFTRQTTVS